MQKSKAVRQLSLMSSAVCLPEKPRTSEVPVYSSMSTKTAIAYRQDVPSKSDSSLTIESVCRREIEQIATQLPLIAAYFVYQNQHNPQRQSVSHCQQSHPRFDPAILSYLESEVWLTADLPRKSLIQLVFPSCQTQNTPKKVAQRTIDQEHQPNVYVYRLNQQDQVDEYLLLWSLASLSPKQLQSIEQQAQLLDDYLAVARKCDRQHEEIQLLEQVLRRGEHQLRSPLALVGLYAENLCLGLPTGLLQEQAIIIRETVQELGANLTHLLDCGKQSKLCVALHDWRKILTETLTILQPQLDNKQLKISYPTTSVTIAVDGWQMKQVLQNILNNAIYFSPQGGVITCDWRVFCNEVLVEISDQGPGLSQDDLKNAFIPFYSKRSGGTGIGLTIAKKVILDHQGSIWVQNLSRGGAQFSFTLPRYESYS